jgi:hypothetical protein
VTAASGQKGAPGENRTRVARVKSPALWPLSYGGDLIVASVESALECRQRYPSSRSFPLAAGKRNDSLGSPVDENDLA